MIYIVSHNCSKTLAKTKSLKSAIAFVENNNLDDAWIKADMNNVWWLMGLMTLSFAKLALAMKDEFPRTNDGYILRTKIKN